VPNSKTHSHEECYYCFLCDEEKLMKNFVGISFDENNKAKLDRLQFADKTVCKKCIIVLSKGAIGR